jgi:type IV secretory pathway VirB6-like protein
MGVSFPFLGEESGMRAVSFMMALMVALVVFLIPELAQAQIMGITLEGDLGNVCATQGSVFSSQLHSGDPNNKDFCNGAAQTGLFARLFCIVETTIGQIIATTFCAVRNAWMAPFTAMMLLLMATTGAGFVLGIINFTVKEVTTLMMKIGLVTLFVVNSEIALNTAFAFFIGIMQATVNMMKDGFEATTISAASQFNGYTGFIKEGTALAGSLTDNLGNANPFAEADDQLNKIRIAVNSADAGQKRYCSVLSFLLGLLLILPPAALIVFLALVTFLGFFARAAYGYLYALVVTVFLIAAMPIFVSCALFRTTYDLFEHWLKYIGSNVIQIFIVFGIMAFASMVDFTTFLIGLDGIIVPYKFDLLSAVGLNNFAGAGGWDLCSICKNPNYIETKVGNLNYTILSIDSTRPCLDPPGTEGVDYFELKDQTKFFRFLIINGAALYILTKVMDGFMAMGPDMARMLGGAKLVHTIGGIATMGGDNLNSAVQKATTNFEKGAKMAAENPVDDPDANWFERNIPGPFKVRDALMEGSRAAKEGPYLIDGKQYKQLREQVFEEDRQLQNDFESALDRYNKASKNLSKMDNNFDSSGNQIYSEDDFRTINEFQHSRKELQRVSQQVNSASRDLEEAMRKEEQFKANNRPVERKTGSETMGHGIDDGDYSGG